MDITDAAEILFTDLVSYLVGSAGKAGIQVSAAHVSSGTLFGVPAYVLMAAMN
jgi:hypothetical protein